MGVETLRGYNLYQPPGCNPQIRNHKQAVLLTEVLLSTRRLLKYWLSGYYSCRVRYCEAVPGAHSSVHCSTILNLVDVCVHTHCSRDDSY